MRYIHETFFQVNSLNQMSPEDPLSCKVYFQHLSSTACIFSSNPKQLDQLLQVCLIRFGAELHTCRIEDLWSKHNMHHNGQHKQL